MKTPPAIKSTGSQQKTDEKRYAYSARLVYGDFS